MFAKPVPMPSVDRSQAVALGARLPRLASDLAPTSGAMPRPADTPRAFRTGVALLSAPLVRSDIAHASVVTAREQSRSVFDGGLQRPSAWGEKEAGCLMRQADRELPYAPGRKSFTNRSRPAQEGTSAPGGCSRRSPIGR